MKTASVTETRQNLSSFLAWIKRNQNDVVIQNRGHAEVVMIPIDDYALLQEARERRRRAQAVQELKKIAQEIGARNEEMSEDQALETADQISREAIDNLVRKGKVTFQD